MQLRSRPFLFYFVLSLGSISVSFATEPEWDLRKQNEDITLWARETEQGLLEVKVQTHVKAAPKALVKLLNDTASAPLWIDHIERVELLGNSTEQQLFVHSFFKSPWPVRNRDMLTRSTIINTGAKGSYQIEVVDMGNEFASSDGYVRMQQVSGLWEVVPMDNEIQITYTGTGSAAGKMPKWLSNKLLLSSTFKTFGGLRAQVALPEYQ